MIAGALETLEELDETVFAASVGDDSRELRLRAESLLASLKICLPPDSPLQARLRRIDEFLHQSPLFSAEERVNERRGGDKLLLEIVALKIHLENAAANSESQFVN